MPSCSIIICSHNRAASLGQTLEAIAGTDIPPWLTIDLIVVDNASVDNTRAVVEAARIPAISVRYLLEPRVGQSYARNAGLAASTGDVILFIDDDLRPPPQWLEAMCLPIVDGSADAVAGGIAVAPCLVRPWMKSMHRGWLASTEWLDPRDPPTMVGGNMAVSRKALEKVAGFDVELGPGQLGFGDDMLFGFQLKAAGCRLVMAKGPAAEHYFDADRLTRDSFLASARKHGRTEAYLDHHWRHLSRRWPRLRLAWAVLRLAAWRAARPSQFFRKDGAEGGEMYHASNVSYWSNYLNEIRRPRAYDRHGLVKNASTRER